MTPADGVGPPRPEEAVAIPKTETGSGGPTPLPLPNDSQPRFGKGRRKAARAVRYGPVIFPRSTGRSAAPLTLIAPIDGPNWILVVASILDLDPGKLDGLQLRGVW